MRYVAAQQNGYPYDFNQYLEEHGLLDAVQGFYPEPAHPVLEEIIPKDPEQDEIYDAAVLNARYTTPHMISLGGEVHKQGEELPDQEELILSVELVLAALEGCSVDNARIEIEDASQGIVPEGDTSGRQRLIEVCMAACLVHVWPCFNGTRSACRGLRNMLSAIASRCVEQLHSTSGNALLDVLACVGGLYASLQMQVPILDGSSMPWVSEIISVGTTPANFRSDTQSTRERYLRLQVRSYLKKNTANSVTKHKIG